MFDAYRSALSGFPGFLLALVGGFYMFAGFALARHMMLDRMLSRAIEMISLEKQSRVETLQQVWMIVSAILIFAGGAALVLLSMLAVWLFAAALVQQVLYLTWAAPRYFDLEDEPDPAGRRQSTNATILYGAATLAVVAAASSGMLLSVLGEGGASAITAAALTSAFASWMIVRLRMPKQPGGGFEGVGGGDDEVRPVDFAEVEGLRLAAEWFELPVWVFFTDGEVDSYSPAELGLSDALGRDLNEWQEAFTSACENAGDEMAPGWTEAQRQTHFGCAAELAGRLREEMRAAGHEEVAVSWMDGDGEIVTLGEPPPPSR